MSLRGSDDTQDDRGRHYKPENPSIPSETVEDIMAGGGLRQKLSVRR
jgi:hypothetical protein